MSASKPLSLKELTDILENEEFWEEGELNHIYIEPPDNNLQSDEDSADEGDGGLIDNLTGRQLQAPAEAVFSRGKRLGGEQWDYEDDLPLSHFVEKPVEWNWTKHGDLNINGDMFPESDYSKYRGMSPLDLFELFMDQIVINFLIQESSKYAQFLNCNDPRITQEEMRCFIGILLVSGYSVVPGEKLYWDNGEDVRNSLIYNSMRRDRFLQIKKYLHCNDNTKLDMTDKMTKIRPFLNLIKERFLQHYVPQPEISYDESMIEYYGRHGCKQYIRGKPIRFGYKVWCMNSKNGYLINFEIYQGSIPNSNAEHQKKFGKAAAPLLQLIGDLPPHIKPLPLKFYFDNLFTSPNLLIHLRKLGYNATGTIRENRVPKNCPIIPTKAMKKKSRGDYDFVLDKEQGILITRWMDNAVVTVASTIHGLNPITTASRCSSAQKKRVGIPRPNFIAQYNSFMGGTDQMDANIGTYYRISVRGKKWYWPIFTYMIDACIQNAWIIMKGQGNNMPQLTFKRYIGQYYLKKYGVSPKGAGRPPSFAENSRVSLDLRYDQTGHLVEEVPNKKRRRCADEKCKSVGRTQCRKCQVGLCVQCFVNYHTR